MIDRLVFYAVNYTDERILTRMIQLAEYGDVKYRCESAAGTVEFTGMPTCIVMVDSLTKRVRELAMCGDTEEFQQMLTQLGELYDAGEVVTNFASAGGAFEFGFGRARQEPSRE
jgi:hypothetical protein